MGTENSIENTVSAFENWMITEEKSCKTREKYLRDLRHFLLFTSGQPLSKELVILYKQTLIEEGYAPRSVNSMLASLNSYLKFTGQAELMVRNLRTQREVYCSENQELTKIEYRRLLDASKDNPRLHLLLQTIAGTGIRISELPYFTVESVTGGDILVRAKGKIRRIMLPKSLRDMLLDYADQRKIRSGSIFCTCKGNPLDRSNVWAQMKALSVKAHVEKEKIYPHNLRKLFARTFYSIEKDIAKLADVLGHSSIDTTRIYIISSGKEHRREIEKMGLVEAECEHKKTPHKVNYVVS